MCEKEDKTAVGRSNRWDQEFVLTVLCPWPVPVLTQGPGGQSHFRKILLSLEGICFLSHRSHNRGTHLKLGLPPQLLYCVEKKIIALRDVLSQPGQVVTIIEVNSQVTKDHWLMNFLCLGALPERALWQPQEGCSKGPGASVSVRT